MSIKGILLAGASLCTISAGAAFAKSMPLVAALHPGSGHATIKTPLHLGPAQHLTSTFSVSTAVSQATDHKVKTKLAATYYTYFHSGTLCVPQKEKVVLSTKKTKYAKLSTSTETYTYSSCSGTPTVYYGDVYDLISKKTPKKPDTFVSTLKGTKIHFNGGVYDIDLNLDLSVTITK
jgi:hypothetical protein